METEVKRRGRPRSNGKEEGETPEAKVTVWASLGMTINTGNFENQKVDIGVAGLPVDASPEFIAEQLDKAKLTLHTAVEALAAEMTRRLSEDYGR